MASLQCPARLIGTHFWQDSTPLGYFLLNEQIIQILPILRKSLTAYGIYRKHTHKKQYTNYTSHKYYLTFSDDKDSERWVQRQMEITFPIWLCRAASYLRIYKDNERRVQRQMEIPLPFWLCRTTPYPHIYIQNRLLVKGYKESVMPYISWSNKIGISLAAIPEEIKSGASCLKLERNLAESPLSSSILRR